jgi:hypothetical protein
VQPIIHSKTRISPAGQEHSQLGAQIACGHSIPNPPFHLENTRVNGKSQGLEEWLNGIREDLRAKTYQPLPVLRVKIPKPARVNAVLSQTLPRQVVAIMADHQRRTPGR